MKMIEGFDMHKDEMGLISREEFICGECNAKMIEKSPKFYKCPKCGTEFNDNKR